MVDKVLTLPREKIGATIGGLDDDVMIRVTRALAMWLGVGAFFMSLGAWPVFGFFGLDLVLLYLAFKLNYRAARAREELTATGSAATPEGSLTVSERRVAQRAAAGATIAEIAEAPMATRSAWTVSQAPRPPHTWPSPRPAG